MTDVLIGYTGFVGSNLARQRPFDICVNSSNIGELSGGSFDTVVCAGVSAVKWKANKEPEADAAGIKALTDVLDTVSARRFVLISTVDVFLRPDGQDETTQVETDGLHPYGLHRLQLEQHLAARFERMHILRLPALFGPGLRKNVLFDLLNDNMLEVINPASSFQWYPTSRLWSDIEATMGAGLPLAHLATEPVRTADILAAHFPGKAVGANPAPQGRYDFHTCHAPVFKGSNPYVMNKTEVLTALGDWLEGARA